MSRKALVPYSPSMRAEVLPLVARSLSPEKAQAVLDGYLGNVRRRLYVLLDDGPRSVEGIIGLAVARPVTITDPIRIEIEDLVVGPGHGPETGQAMIASLPTVTPCREVVAGADGGSVDFYRRLGFVCDRLGQGSGGIEQYWCYLRLPEGQPVAGVRAESVAR